MPPAKPELTFKVRVALVRWHDGDTFFGVLDQGRGIFHAAGMHLVHHEGEDPTVEVEVLRHRCAKIQAPELVAAKQVSPAGAAATKYARELAPPGIYECLTYKADDNFDRPLIELILSEGLMFSDVMLAAGHAIPYH
jgi:endonuclease YncB( thermonuclease family)